MDLFLFDFYYWINVAWLYIHWIWKATPVPYSNTKIINVKLIGI